MADTPALHPSNITGSLGSTWAGISTALIVVGQNVQNGPPTSLAGWIAVAAALLTSLGAVFGR